MSIRIRPGSRRQPSRRRLSSVTPAVTLAGVALVAAACSSGTSTGAAAPKSTATQKSTAPSSSATATRGGKAHAHHRTQVTGIVRARSVGDITVLVKRSSETIALGTTTRFRKSGHTVDVSALVDGLRVRIALVPGDSTPTAASVAILPPELTGTVGTISSSGFTVVTRIGALHGVTTTPSTRYRTGKTPATASALHSGEHVRVTGTSLANGTTDAGTVVILAAKTG